MKKRLLPLLLILTLLAGLCGCADTDKPAAEVQTQVFRDEKFGAALMALDQAEFELPGFTLGDSCSITFENGYTLTDVPYYDGFYVKNAMPVIVAYPGDPCVRITLNLTGIWDAAKLKDGDAVTVTLLEKGKYLPTQEALGQSYSFDRADYETDEEFCNFRALTGGTLKENLLYRGASPVDNSRGRAAYTDALLEENGVRFVVDLADSEADMAGYMAEDDFASDYTAGLYAESAMVLLDMSSDYQSEAYRKSVAAGLRQVLAMRGPNSPDTLKSPVYIHCMEGKDRTGFVCALLEALAGATYDEMLRDYMLTYQNYFKINAETAPEKYAAVAELYFSAFQSFLHGTEDTDILQNADFTEDAKVYLRSGGMTDEEITQLIDLITE